MREHAITVRGLRACGGDHSLCDRLVAPHRKWKYLWEGSKHDWSWGSAVSDNAGSRPQIPRCGTRLSLAGFDYRLEWMLMHNGRQVGDEVDSPSSPSPPSPPPSDCCSRGAGDTLAGAYSAGYERVPGRYACGVSQQKLVIRLGAPLGSLRHFAFYASALPGQDDGLPRILTAREDRAIIAAKLLAKSRPQLARSFSHLFPYIRTTATATPPVI
jgi:hypothetical protein